MKTLENILITTKVEIESIDLYFDSFISNVNSKTGSYLCVS